ncbi:MAG: ABC transporter permease [Nitriliruptoraceae bacterium]
MSEHVEVRPTSARRSVTSWLMQYAFLAGFAALIVTFTITTSVFLTPQNLLNVLEGSMILLFVALAMTMVVSSGGIDLSVGVALDFGAWFAIAAMLTFDLHWALAVVLALVGGAIVGALNAFLIVGLGVTPFLATLGTFFIGRSAQQIGTGGGANISFRDAPDGFHRIATGDIAGIPNEVIIGLLVLAVFFVVLERTTHGARIDAMGLQDSAARIAGIRTRRYRALVFILSGVTASIGGIILSSGLRIYTPNAGFAYLLDAIASVFIGASMHPRYRPNVPGTLVGVLFLGVLGNGLDLLGLDFNLKAALRGGILVVALALAFAVAKRAAHRQGD